jgi:CheY-like chemotaxis protein
MALRVLLADESVTIKKVIQLALQDFAVEVKAVPVGLDVLEVSKSFQPDLVFADILLQKRSGYDVCSDLKKDPQTAAIPVILMWSSFMELDQKQVEACGADGRLEKPFEVEALRKLVLELVPRTRSQRLAHFLEYPASIAAPLKAEVSAPAVAPTAQPMASAPPAAPPSMAKAPRRDPFAPIQASHQTPEPANAAPESPMEFTIPERPRPAKPSGPPPELKPEIKPEPTPLGALPDLNLEGHSATPSGGSSNWNMESFEPVDLPELTLDAAGSDDEADGFQPIKLPTSAPAKTNERARATELEASLILTTDDDDQEDEKWASRSLDKYRLPPLQPDESLGVDDMTPNFGEQGREPYAQQPSSQAAAQTGPSTGSFSDKTELITPPPAKKPKEAPHTFESADVSEFSLSDDDYDRTSLLEIEHIDASEKTRPAIVRELLKDPDFTLTTPPRQEAAIDLGSAGRANDAGSGTSSLDATKQLEQRLEANMEKTIERVVSELLPKIAERIIKKELERLLEDS